MNEEIRRKNALSKDLLKVCYKHELNTQETVDVLLCIYIAVIKSALQIGPELIEEFRERLKKDLWFIKKSLHIKSKR